MTTTKNFSIQLGSDKEIQLTLKKSDGTVIDTTGYEFEMHLRAKKDGVSIDRLSIDNGRITNDGTGVVVLKFPHEVTEELPSGTAYYDLRVCSNNKYFYILEGTISLTRMITR